MWLIVSNIMLLNLVIAMFSNTYDKLYQIGDGIFLKEVLDNRDMLKYDEMFGSLILVPYPFNIVFFPFHIALVMTRSKFFNEVLCQL